MKRTKKQTEISVYVKHPNKEPIRTNVKNSLEELQRLVGELSEFIVPSKFGCVNDGKCKGCIYFGRGNGFNVDDDCNAPFCTDDYKPLRRPPQSWCYVEDGK